MAVFALVDCNNFYASCERLFRPGWRGRPVVVLSNNDGCVIARSAEAKVLGVAMGAPLFKIRDLIKAHDIVVCSSNYALYGDLSARVMSVLAASAPRQEVYSIDECFLDLDQMAVDDLTAWCQELRGRVHQWTGIPVSIGVGPTKTLAKLANRLAKKSAKAQGVLDLSGHPEWCETALKRTPVGDVWGIGRRWAKMLEGRGIMTAHDLAQASDGWVRQRMGVVGLRTVHELRGIVCHDLEEQPPPKQTVCCTRSFASAVSDKAQVRDALLSFAMRAAQKARKEAEVAGAVHIFMQTDRHRAGAAQKSVSASTTFARPTSDSRHVVEGVMRLFERIWCEGYGWRKAGVLLLDLSAPKTVQPSLFDAPAPPRDGLMAAMDQINARFGRGSAGLGLARKGGQWRMRQDQLSPHYTTRWGDLPRVRVQ